MTRIGTFNVALNSMQIMIGIVAIGVALYLAKREKKI
jgi:uncharacterized membrane protein YiaA